MFGFEAAYTHLGKKTLAAVVNNSSITMLSVSGNDIDDADAIQLAGMKLKKLYAAANNIGPAGGVALAHNTTLNTLDINQNHVGDEAAFEFAKTTTLGELYIAFNHLTKAGIDAIEANQHLYSYMIGEGQQSQMKVDRRATHKFLIETERLSHFSHA